MSGILGIYYLNGQTVDPENIQQMVDKLAHRGPDGADIWCSESVGLGHRMLWTTPESLLEKLPMVSEDGNLVITSDCRIDNREELLSTLQLSNCPPEKVTDTQLILAAYQEWGENCPQHLLGDFAFAIWDGKEQKLFCARDHMGVKPFYYYYYASESAFVFGSEIKAIFCLPEVPRQISEVRIGDYLTSMFHDTALTSYENIFRLQPAHKLTVSLEGIQLNSYWSLDPKRELILGSDEEYAEEFRKIFTEAVRCRLRSAFPIGSMLSGGLDSSSITCTARKLLTEDKSEQQLHSFSAVFDKLAECDERPYINAVIDQGGIEPHYVKADSISPLTDLERMFWHQDEAFYAPNWSMGWELYKSIQGQGVRVVLDGFDGDTVVSDGYGYLSELAQAGKWITLTVEVRELAKTFNGSFRKWLWGYVRHYGINPTISKYLLLRIIRRIWQKLTQPFHREDKKSTKQPAWSAMVNPEFAQQIGLAERYQVWRKLQGHFGLDEREQHYRNIATQGLPSFALEYMDKATAACSIDQRYPFWDKRLVEFCLALPAKQKLHLGLNRIVMRRAMENILPVKVQWRRGKADFSPNLSQGLLFEQKRLEELIFNNLGALEKYIDSTTLQEIYQQFIRDKSQTLDMNARQIWIVISLALWFDYTLQNQPDEIRKKEVKTSVVVI